VYFCFPFQCQFLEKGNVAGWTSCLRLTCKKYTTVWGRERWVGKRRRRVKGEKGGRREADDHLSYFRRENSDEQKKRGMLNQFTPLIIWVRGGGRGASGQNRGIKSWDNSAIGSALY